MQHRNAPPDVADAEDGSAGISVAAGLLAGADLAEPAAAHA
jgi:hypothetical protein